MAHIGTFTSNPDGSFIGEIVTLTFQSKNVRIVPDENRTNDNAPTHRIIIDHAEIGAAWSKTSKEGRPYLGVKLDDPSFVAPIYASLFEDADGKAHTLFWSRSGRRSGE